MVWGLIALTTAESKLEQDLLVFHPSRQSGALLNEEERKLLLLIRFILQLFITLV